MAILDEGEIVYVARAAQRRVMSIALVPGSRLPAYCTSMGRVLLAALPKDRAREILHSSVLIARTPNTLTDQEAILTELERVRRQGFAAVDQEVEIRLRSIAVPLRNPRGLIVAALNTGLPVCDESMSTIIDRYLSELLTVSKELLGIVLA